MSCLGAVFFYFDDAQLLYNLLEVCNRVYKEVLIEFYKKTLQENGGLDLSPKMKGYLEEAVVVHKKDVVDYDILEKGIFYGKNVSE